MHFQAGRRKVINNADLPLFRARLLEDNRAPGSNAWKNTLVFELSGHNIPGLANSVIIKHSL